MISLAAMLFFVVILVSFFRPICFPLSLAVSIPSLVR